MRKQRSRGDYRPERLDLSGALARSAEPGVVVVDPARRIAAFNPAAERVTQRAAAAMLGQPVETLPSPLRELAQATLDSGDAVVDRPLVLVAEGKTKVVLFASTVAIRGAGDQLLGVLLTFHDLTAAREFERLTERLQRLGMLGVLSAGVVHEIKNALVAVKSFAELLLEKQQDVEMVTLVVQEVNRINSLVGQLLKLAGPARPVFGEVSVHAALHNALRLIKHQLKNRSIELIVALEAGQDVVRGDAKQLEQAFINLLLNAVEAMGETGRLTVATEIVFATEVVSKFEPRTRKQQLQVTIQDTGAGIPPPILTHLFSPFQTTKLGGTGLGLAITRRIVVTHGGRIHVESEPQRGATFRITLPLVQKAPATDTPAG
jgi:signal transduction histidine kinase